MPILAASSIHGDGRQQAVPLPRHADQAVPDLAGGVRLRANHMQLVPVEGFTTLQFQLNPGTLCRHLREAIFGPSGYWNELAGSPQLQERYLRFLLETKSYTIKM